jgi:hypothetical protein
MEALRPLACLLGEAGIGSYHNEIRECLGGDGIAHDRKRIEIVDGYLEETLELWCVQVEGDDAVDSSCLDGIRAHPGTNR